MRAILALIIAAIFISCSNPSSPDSKVTISNQTSVTFNFSLVEQNTPNLINGSVASHSETKVDVKPGGKYYFGAAPAGGSGNMNTWVYSGTKVTISESAGYYHLSTN